MKKSRSEDGMDASRAFCARYASDDFIRETTIGLDIAKRGFQLHTMTRTPVRFVDSSTDAAPFGVVAMEGLWELTQLG